MKNKTKYLLLLPLTFLVMSNSAAPINYDKVDTSYAEFNFIDLEKNEQNEEGEYTFDPQYHYRAKIQNYGDYFIGEEYIHPEFRFLIDGQENLVEGYGDLIVYPHETKEVYISLYNSEELFEVEDVVKMEATGYHLPTVSADFVVQTIEYNHDENYTIFTIDFENDFAQNYARYVTFSYNLKNDTTQETFYTTSEYSSNNVIRVKAEGLLLESDLINKEVTIHYSNTMNDSPVHPYSFGIFFLLILFILAVSVGVLLIVGLIFLIIHLAKPKDKTKIEEKENKKKEKKEKKNKEKEENVEVVSDDEKKVISNDEVVITTVKDDNEDGNE